MSTVRWGRRLFLVSGLFGVVPACSSTAEQDGAPAPVLSSVVPPSTATPTSVTVIDVTAPSSAVATTGSVPPTEAPPTTAVALTFDFSEPESVDGWTTVDDPVMGGRSESTLAWADGALEFSGVVSLENNGGFVSLVSPFNPALGEASLAADGLRLRGRGDGKTVAVQLRAGADQTSYLQRFVASSTFDVLLPFADFVPTTRFLDPEPDGPAVDPRAISQLAIYIVDKQDGPFTLSLEAIG